ncbi:MAG: hypothetical protein AB7F43_03440 [Bacteriovoracia bacterium]
MGVIKGALASALAMFLTFTSADLPTQRVCAQNLHEVAPRHWPKEKPIELSLYSSSRPDDELIVKAQLGVGSVESFVGDRENLSSNYENRINLSYGKLLSAELYSANYFSFPKQRSSSDLDRLWSKTELTLETLPLEGRVTEGLDDLNSRVLLGVISRARFYDTTPSGDKYNVYGSVSPELYFQDGKLEIRFAVGGYYYFLKLNKNFINPKNRPQRSNDLRVESWGMVCRADASYEFENGIRSGGYGELLVGKDGKFREANTGVHVDFPIDPGWFFSDTEAFKNCSLYVQLYGDARFFDLGDKYKDLLDFNEAYAVGFQIMIEIGPLGRHRPFLKTER